MAKNDDNSMGIISIIGGIILLLAGAWLRSQIEQFTGDWPEALSIGCFISGIGSIAYGVNILKNK